jgi:hypothetical protein
MTPRNKFVKMKRAADGDYPSDIAGLVNYYDTNSNRQIRNAQDKARAEEEDEIEREEENEYEQEKKAFVKIRTEREQEFSNHQSRERGDGEDKIGGALESLGNSLFAIFGFGSDKDEKPKFKSDKSIDEKTK